MSDPLGLLIGLAFNLAVLGLFALLTWALGIPLRLLPIPPWLASGIAASHAIVLAFCGVGWLLHVLMNSSKRGTSGPETLIGRQILGLISLGSLVAVAANLALRPLHLEEWVEQLVAVAVGLLVLFRGMDLMIESLQRRRLAKEQVGAGSANR